MAYNVEENSIAVIYNGVDINLFRPEATPAIHLVGSPPQPYIVSVGSYIPRKGHRSLLDAFAKVVKRYPSLGLVIVGMDGPERAKLLERAKILELGGSVTLLVNAKPPEVAVVVAGATLCVQSSTAEPFGLAVIEAGACGVPVLVTAVGGHVELITDQKNGFLFAVGDVDQCAEKIIYILMHSDITRKISETFRTEIQIKYTWHVCANTYLQKLGKVCTIPAAA